MADSKLLQFFFLFYIRVLDSCCKLLRVKVAIKKLHRSFIYYIEPYINIMYVESFLKGVVTVEDDRFIRKFILKKKQKQEAHGPHRSPVKTVQINKHI